MTDVPPPDPTEELLRGADRPRPLPPALRQRLADRLMAANQGEAPAVTPTRPLPSDLRARLEDALPSEGTPDVDGGDDGADGVPAPGQRPAWRWVNPAAAVAAAVLVVAAVVGLSVRGGGPTKPLTTAAASSSSTARAAAPPKLSASGEAGGAGVTAGAGGAAANSAPLARQPAAGGGMAGSGASGGAAAPGGTAAAPSVPAPSVSAVAPSTGPAAGGTWVTVTGQNLGAATQVRFGATPARQLVVVSGTELRVLSPAHDLGTVDLTVVTPGGTSAATPGDRYTFLP